MSTDDDGHAGVIMMAFVMGAITGAAAALLIAPAGTETRRVLNEKAREGRDKASDAARHGADFVRRQRDQLSKTIDTAIDRGREAEQGARESDPIGTEDQG
jgi:gas vesicle protein